MYVPAEEGPGRRKRAAKGGARSCQPSASCFRWRCAPRQDARCGRFLRAKRCFHATPSPRIYCSAAEIILIVNLLLRCIINYAVLSPSAEKPAPRVHGKQVRGAFDRLKHPSPRGRLRATGAVRPAEIIRRRSGLHEAASARDPDRRVARQAKGQEHSGGGDS